MLKLGDEGRAVAETQRSLIGLGYDLGSFPPYQDPRDPKAKFPPGADGKMGERMVDAVKLFQADRDLPVTGQVDGLTSSLIRAPHLHDQRYALKTHTHTGDGGAHRHPTIEQRVAALEHHGHGGPV